MPRGPSTASVNPREDASTKQVHAGKLKIRFQVCDRWGTGHFVSEDKSHLEPSLDVHGKTSTRTDCFALLPDAITTARNAQRLNASRFGRLSSLQGAIFSADTIKHGDEGFFYFRRRFTFSQNIIVFFVNPLPYFVPTASYLGVNVICRQTRIFIKGVLRACT